MDVRVANDLHAYEQTVKRSMKIGPLLIFNGLADFLRRILFNSKYAVGHFSFRQGVLESTDLSLANRCSLISSFQDRAQRTSPSRRRQALIGVCVKGMNHSCSQTIDSSPFLEILRSCS